ncbi:MAG: hypothetical protein IPL40_13995 [Proteobacteria bacterium]|nr:hypothetical protein [Pseudomonadota bacterium]
MYRELQSFPRQRRATSSSMLIALLLASTASTGALAQGLDPNAGFQDDYSDVIDDQTLPEEAPLDDGTPITDVAPPPEAYAAPPMAGDPAAQGYAPAPDGPGTVYRPASTLPPGLATHYRTLAPYGRWLHLPELGPVWVPDRAVVGDGFVPYSTGGEWMPTDQGSMFVARAWSWGWLPFHYGRWFRHRSLGWAWRPGSVWAPAWVRWRVGGDYIGWAPMPPAARYFANSSWVFADQDNWLGPRIHERLLPRQRWSVAFGLTTPYTRSVIYRDGRARARWYRGPEPRASWAGRYRPIRVKLRRAFARSPRCRSSPSAPPAAPCIQCPVRRAFGWSRATSPSRGASASPAASPRRARCASRARFAAIPARTLRPPRQAAS